MADDNKNPPADDQNPTGDDTTGGSGLSDDDERWVIPDETLEKYPDMVEMIKHSESMDDDERNYWFQILPSMTDEQVQNLRNILETETQKLAEIDQKYQDDLQKIHTKHETEWSSFERKKKAEALKQAEKEAEKEETETEEDLLKKLEEL